MAKKKNNSKSSKQAKGDKVSDKRLDRYGSNGLEGFRDDFKKTN